jgi:hypothetical protein
MAHLWTVKSIVAICVCCIVRRGIFMASCQGMAGLSSGKFGMVLFNFVPLRFGNPTHPLCMALVFGRIQLIKTTNFGY